MDQPPDPFFKKMLSSTISTSAIKSASFLPSLFYYSPRSLGAPITADLSAEYSRSIDLLEKDTVRTLAYPFSASSLISTGYLFIDLLRRPPRGYRMPVFPFSVIFFDF